ncbi:MAG: acyl-CoA carboxylase subunit beta [Saprospiraceae bacterium]
MSDQLIASQNEDEYKLAISKLQRKLEEIYQGGGKKKIEKLHQEGKLHARERIQLLIDKGTEFLEIGALAALDMYAEEGGCPAAGVVCGLGKIHGRICMVVANDASVKAGAWFPMTGKKNLRAQEIAMENYIPIIYLVDSAGVFLPMQDEIFPDKEHFGRIFRNNAKMSSMGIPQIAAVMGACVAGGAYLPIMSDEALIVENTGSIFLAGPYLVKAAIGENVDKETLGGADTTTEISGIIDHKMPDDTSCLERIRELVKGLGHKPKAGFDRIPSIEPASPASKIFELIPFQSNKPFPIIPVLQCIVDKDSMIPYKEEYGKTIFCTYARIDGWSVGILANNREVIRAGKGEMQFGGVIYSDSADKATRFILNCNQKHIPLIFLQDVTGFMVGTRSEQGGIIKDGAKMVNAVANSTVPKFTIIIGNSYGAGNYAMCGKAYDPRLIVAWPSAKIAVMGGHQAAKVLTDLQIHKLKSKGHEPNPEEEKELYKKIKDQYEEQESPYYAAARLWVDGIINPLDTRNFIATGIEMASHAPVEKFNVGVIQV